MGRLPAIVERASRCSHRFKVAARVRIPLGVLYETPAQAGCRFVFRPSAAHLPGELSAVLSAADVGRQQSDSEAWDAVAGRRTSNERPTYRTAASGERISRHQA